MQFVEVIYFYEIDDLLKNYENLNDLNEEQLEELKEFEHSKALSEKRM